MSDAKEGRDIISAEPRKKREARESRNEPNIIII
jgi:hypothetical protein